jgi:hypothetical protein
VQRDFRVAHRKDEGSASSGPFTDEWPTFGAECRLIAALQTRRRPVLKVGT